MALAMAVDRRGATGLRRISLDQLQRHRRSIGVSDVRARALVSCHCAALAGYLDQRRCQPRLLPESGRDDWHPGTVLRCSRLGRHYRFGRSVASFLYCLDGTKLAADLEPVVGSECAALHADDVSAFHPDRAYGARPLLEYCDHGMVTALAWPLHQRIRSRPLGILNVCANRCH